MKHWLLCITAAVIALATAVQADDATRVRAVVDRTVLSPGESLQLTVTVSNGQGRVDLEPLSDFNVYSRGTSTSMQIINGRTTREESHTYLLIPKRQGELTIPALAVRVNGRVLKTEPITVVVSDRPGADRAEKVREIWVDASISAKRPYVGQQLTYTFSLFQSVQLTDATFEPPDFEGFAAEELKERDSRREVVNGRQVVVTQIHYVLTPLAPGRLEIEPAVLQAGIVRPDNRRRQSPFDDFFNDPFLRGRRVEPKVLQSRTLTVQVQPLPPPPGDQPFSGLIGRFTLKAEVERRQLKVGDSTTLAVAVRGEGNVMDAEPPLFEPPDALKTYTDAPEETIELLPSGYRGKKVFRTALVPVKTGTISLPPIRLTYFDVARDSYRTLSVDLPPLQVAAADEASGAPLVVSPGATPASRKQAVAFTGRDILPPKTDLKALQIRRPLTWPFFILWILAPAAGYALLVSFQRIKRRDLSATAKMRIKAQQAVKAAERAKNQELQAFLTPLYRAVTAAILYKAGRSGESLTWQEAETALDAAGVDPETVRRAVALLTTIETGKYSGAAVAADQRSDLLQTARAVVKRLAP